MNPDAELRTACFLALDALRARWPHDIPYEALRKGFRFGATDVPFLNKAYGIYRAAVQRGPAALSVNSSYTQRRYQDRDTPGGILYHYQDGPVDNHFNRALRAAEAMRVPVVYFRGVRSGGYLPLYPFYVEEDYPDERQVLLAPGHRQQDPGDREWLPINDPIERRYAVHEVRQRLHQAQFRAAVLPAYRDQCAICTLKEPRLLDAAHIVPDADERGEPRIANGVSLCTIHHRAYDEDLVGISPDCRVNVSRRLLEDEDGPMLELLKGFHLRPLALPQRRGWRPDPELLAVRFERFQSAST